MPPRKRMRVEAAKPEEFKPPAQEVKTNEPADFASISDKEMLSVFSLLPLCDLQSLELVSRRVRSIVLLVYPLRRSLSLLQVPQYRERLTEITRYWYLTDYTTRYTFGEDCYHVTREINSIGVHWLGQRFPNITKLALFCVDHLCLERFVELIGLYPTLESLVLFSTDGQKVEYAHERFWTALYGVELRHFASPFEFEFRPNEEVFDQFDEMAQLHPFRGQFEPEVRRLYITYNQDDNLQGAGLLYQKEDNCRVLLSMELLPTTKDIKNPDFGATRCGLYLQESVDGQEQDRRSTKFTLRREVIVLSEAYFTHLDLAIPSTVDLLSILPELSQLNLLTHIRFTETKSGQPSHSQFFSGLNRHNYRSKLGMPKRTSMPSVRQLNLYQFDIESSSLIFLYFSVVFPRTLSLHLEDCHMTNSTDRRTFPGWLLKSLDNFTYLRELYHNYRLMLVKMYSVDGELSKSDRIEMRQAIQTEIVDKARI